MAQHSHSIAQCGMRTMAPGHNQGPFDVHLQNTIQRMKRQASERAQRVLLVVLVVDVVQPPGIAPSPHVASPQ